MFNFRLSVRMVQIFVSSTLTGTCCFFYYYYFYFVFIKLQWTRHHHRTDVCWMDFKCAAQISIKKYMRTFLSSHFWRASKYLCLKYAASSSIRIHCYLLLTCLVPSFALVLQCVCMSAFFLCIHARFLQHTPCVVNICCIYLWTCDTDVCRQCLRVIFKEYVICSNK